MILRRLPMLHPSILIRAACLAGGVATAAHAASAAKNTPVTLFVSTEIPVGANQTSVAVVTVPAGKRLVIQTISYNRSGAAAGSIGQIVLGSFGGEISLPNALANGAVLPAATLAATIYVDAGVRLNASVFRSGSTAATEIDNVTVIGYYEKP